MLAADSGGSSLTYETSEGNSLDFVKWTARRWTRRIEGSLARDLDIFPQGDRFYAEFLMDAILRGDSAARATYYTAALDPVKGWMVRDEVRDRENLPALTDKQRAELDALAEKAKPAPTVVQNGAPADAPTDTTTTTEGDQ
jgi:phage portal protein BeeE